MSVPLVLFFLPKKSIFDKPTSLFLFSWSSIGLSVKGDTLVLMVNGVEKEYATLHRSEDDSKTMADGKVHLLYDSTGRTSRDVSIFFSFKNLHSTLIGRY